MILRGVSMVIETSTDERQVFLSKTPAGRFEYRLAWGAMLVSAAAFLLAAPFAKMPLAQVWAFIPIYESALVIGDMITAVMLFGQYSILRSRSLLVLACAYLFTALLTVAHALTFPGLFSATGLLGAGPQSTAWLYMFWHAGFPIAVIAYALLKHAPGERAGQQGRARGPILWGMATVLALVCAGVLLATAGHGLLPPIMAKNRSTPALLTVVSCVWGLSAVALGLLWYRRPHTVLDLLLMVTMCAWLFDIALSAVLNGGRFDLGFYAGRIYGLLAANFVLVILLVENTMLYARLAADYGQERHERQRAQQQALQLVALNKELDAFSYSVSHDLQAPLRAIQGFSTILQESHQAQLDEEGRRLLRIVSGNAQKMTQLIRDLLEFSRLGRQRVNAIEIDMNALVSQVVGELRLAGDGARAQCIVDPLPAAWGDRSLMRQVWVNLISNAFKYSGVREQPRIQVSGRILGQECVYSVQDEGVGFDMQYYDQLFGIFKRLHGADQFPGTGVGLAIVHRIVTRHGGRIWAQGSVGKGATFQFALPCVEAGQRAPPDSSWGAVPSTV
ncbi:MAG TPA: MASE4 domain-containing protein [Burkholderiaceae bacterium]|nr:MASE4 domain-containing protein [Burkholderiaceae bacterium]